MLARVFRLGVLGVALALLLTGCSHSKRQAAAKKPAGPPPPTQHFVSRPDLKPPPVNVLGDPGATFTGYVFLAPKMKVEQAGPMILDNNGQVVWFKQLDTHGVADFRVQHYRGKPVLTW